MIEDESLNADEKRETIASIERVIRSSNSHILGEIMYPNKKQAKRQSVGGGGR